MGVLLMFNKADRITIEEVTALTNLKDRELKRTLAVSTCRHFLCVDKLTRAIVQSLITSKILIKEPRTKQFAPADQLTLNLKFTSKRLRFKPAAVMQKETKEENKETHKSIEEDRKLFLQVTAFGDFYALKSYNLIVPGCYCSHHESP